MAKQKKEKQDRVIVAGKRKTAIAKATIKRGSGTIKINKKPYQNLSHFKRLMIEEPINITREFLGNFDLDISVSVKGGGQESQIEAARLAVAKAIVKFTGSAELRKAFLNYDRNLLIADTRRKEAYKPGDSKARRKRQKSYR